ncbi:hypothetical protein KXV77_009555, partial [Aspergillus fumigatus]
MLSAGERPQPAIGKNAAATRAQSSLSHSPAPMWSVQPKPEQVQHIWVVTGPAGCGKSTVGRGLQAALN